MKTKEDHFVMNHDPSELKVAAEFLTNWLPFLTKNLCHNCSQTLSNRVLALDPDFSGEALQFPSKEIHCDCDTNSVGSWKESSIGCSQHVPAASVQGDSDTNSVDRCKDSEVGCSQYVPEKAYVQDISAAGSPSTRAYTEEDGYEEGGDIEEEEASKQILSAAPERNIGKKVSALSREQREYLRFKMVKRKKDFVCMGRVDGTRVNILDGLELHTGVFSGAEQKRIVDFIYALEAKGRKGELKERTFSAPEKWMPGKGRVTIQFGCCYNYAVLKDGSPPGILRNKHVDAIPELFKVMIRRLVGWHIIPPTCVPDSCIVNIYEEGDCIPPHIDHHDFLRPFCSVSFLSECNILFGASLRATGPGEFSGAVAIPLPLGSVLVLNGNGADVAKHCVPAVPTKRISITFRKMDETKHPTLFVPEPDLQGLQPLPYDVDDTKSMDLPKSPPQINSQPPPRRSLDLEEKGRRLSGRGSRSEPRHSGRAIFSPEPGLKGRLPPQDNDESEDNITPPRFSPQINRRPVTREVESEKRRGFSDRDRLPLCPIGSEGTSEPQSGQIQSQPSSRPMVRVSLGT